MFDKYREEIEKFFKSINGYGEVRLERKEWLSISVKNGIVESFSNKIDMGGFVRVLLKGHGWGVATFNNLDELNKSFADAIDASRIIIPDETIRIVESEPVNALIENVMEDSFDSHTQKEKVEMLLRYNDLIRSDSDKIILASNMYSNWRLNRLYMNTFGASIEHRIGDGIVYATARSRNGNDVQQYTSGWSNRQNFSVLNSLDNKVKKVKDIAVRLLDAKPIKGGNYTVILDPLLAGVFIHEAFGHLSESDFILDNPQAQKMMTLGRRFGPSFLNIIDDGTVKPELHGTIIYDDEGVPAQKNYLVENGVLVGRLHNRETASKLGENLTGNARAQSYRNVPLVRMTNTAIEAGPHSKSETFDGLKEGVYAIDAYGGQTMLENFSFSASYGFMIRDGEIAEMVRDVVLQGNLFNTLAHIERVADDFRWGK